MDPFGAGAALHWLTLPGHISSALEAGKDGARVRKNVTTHQEKKETGRERENRRLILRKLCVALLRLFRGQHSKKIKGSAQGNWDPQ